MRRTLETKCKNRRCDHVFEPTDVLYGNACFRRCPKCGRMVDQKMQPDVKKEVRS